MLALSAYRAWRHFTAFPSGHAPPVATAGLEVRAPGRLLLLRELLDRPPDEVRLGLLDAEALELGSDLAPVVGGVIDHVPQHDPRREDGSAAAPLEGPRRFEQLGREPRQQRLEDPVGPLQAAR